MKYQIWYMRPEHFASGILSQFSNSFDVARPDPDNLDATHIHLKELECGDLPLVFWMMQAEHWSPNGEARDLIESKGLGHTSMSVGDVAVDEAGNVWLVKSMGWENLCS